MFNKKDFRLAALCAMLSVIFAILLFAGCVDGSKAPPTDDNPIETNEPTTEDSSVSATFQAERFKLGMQEGRFFLDNNAPARINSFRAVPENGDAIYLHNVAADGENYVFSSEDEAISLSVKIKETPSYISFVVTGFYCENESFGKGSVDFNLRGSPGIGFMPLDYMTKGKESIRGQNIEISFPSIWDDYPGNPKGGFALYKSDNKNEEEECIMKIKASEAIFEDGTFVPTPPQKEDTLNIHSIKRSGVDYTVMEYVPKIPAKAEPEPERGGTNYALNKKTTTSGDYSGYSGSMAVDGNKNTMWASDAVTLDPWIQIDLGEPLKIGRVEITGRPDANHSLERLAIAIQVSNDENFDEYETLAEKTGTPYPHGAAWIANCELSGTYRYVRIQRLYYMGHFAIGEIKVFDEKAELSQLVSQNQAPVQNAPDGAKMIISFNGKALSSFDGNAALISYDFQNSQRWILEEYQDGCLIKNVAEDAYLTLTGDGILKLAAQGQAWQIEGAGAGWSRISNKDGYCLSMIEGSLAVARRSTESKNELFDIGEAYREDLPNSDASWMNEIGYGIMYHLLPDINSRHDMDKNVDVKAIAEQFEQAGAGYFLLATGQNSGIYTTPNDKLRSLVPLEMFDGLSTERDFPAEFSDELEKRDMGLMLYGTASIPAAYDASIFGHIDNGSFNGSHTRDSAMLWSLVHREWSERYGDKVKGWWMDGAYSSTIQDEKIFTILACGLKSGNPNAAISFNPGIVIMLNSKEDDYTAGEINFPFGSDDLDKIRDKSKWVTPKNYNFPIDDKQWFTLTFLNVGWLANDGPRASLYPADVWAEYVKTVLGEGGAICLDVGYDPQSGYKIIDKLMEMLVAIKG